MSARGSPSGYKRPARFFAGNAYEALGLCLWIVALVGFVVYGARQWVLHRPLVGLVSEHWVPVSFPILVVLMIAGQLGAKLGLPGLFRDAPPRPEGWGVMGLLRGPWHALRNSGAFLGALGATLLVAQVWTSIYFADLIDHPKHSSFGPSFLNHSELLSFLTVTCPPFVIMVGLAAVFPAPAPGIERHGVAYYVELFRYFLGIVVAYAAVGIGIWLGGLIHQHILGSTGLTGIYSLFHGMLRVDDTFDAQPQWQANAAVLMVSYGLFLLVTLVYLLILGELLHDSLSPGLAICLLFGYGVVVYSILVSLKTIYQFPIVTLVVIWLVVCNRNAYKYHFPRMGDYYSARVKLGEVKLDANAQEPPLLKAIDVLEAWWWRAAEPKLPSQVNVEAGNLLRELRGTLTPEERGVRWGKLDSLRTNQGSDLAKPKLVLVAVTGAAYRSAFWTATVLDELCRFIPDLPRNIRLMTGASGGMVGAGYYSAMSQATGAVSGDVVGRLEEESRLDSLTPVVRRLLRRDLTRGFWPLPQDVDRGIVLEEQWKTLSTTFDDLRPGEQEGWRPSLIVSPMIVETARRLLISNLDLSDVAATMSAVPAAPGSGPELYSRSACEFFRFFPKAYSTFLLQTAVRMNATFPYLSPSVSLPIEPPWRVVDAAYYDNYGVDLAATWAYVYRDWIARNTSGLALIQIRAYPSEQLRKQYFVPERDAPQGAAARVFCAQRTAFQWLTTPAEGAGNALAWSTSFRNDEAIRCLDESFNQPGKNRLFKTFVFENPLKFAMNWFLSHADIDDMKRSIGAPFNVSGGNPGREQVIERISAANLEQKRLLTEWWNR